MERTLEHPLLRAEEVRDGAVFRHGTVEFRPLLVAEEIIGAVACVRVSSCRFLTD